MPAIPSTKADPAGGAPARVEAALKCLSCKEARDAPVHMISLPAMQEITPYQRVHPDRGVNVAFGFFIRVQARWNTG
jgi:hypothetical protein